MHLEKQRTRKKQGKEEEMENSKEKQNLTNFTIRVRKRGGL